MYKNLFMIRFVFFLSLSGFIFSCSSSGDDTGKALPSATGKSGDIIIIMDSLQWKDELGKEVRKIFEAEMNGLANAEPMFNLIWVHPNKKIKLLTQIRNLVYVFALDKASSGTRVITDNLSEKTISSIRSDSSFYLVNKKNEYARGQEVMYLFGNTTSELIHHLRRDGQRIQDFFNTAERQRMMTSIKKTVATKSHTELLKRDYNITLHFPTGFKLVQQESDFIWFRSPEAEIDKNFFMARKPYKSEYQLMPDSIIAWRESLCKNYLFEDPDMPESYIVTELEIPFIPVRARQVNFNDKFGMELRGLWRTNTKTMGGPFISYAFVNEADNYVYYLEGFIYSPAKKQRELIREMGAIAYTFEASSSTTTVKK